ncbi:MAG: rRNA pseudouridine synthase [Lachnospiraceae bacterium]|nr:rRNA pseudouridine synthase [Lachnospiraceae bacterium]
MAVMASLRLDKLLSELGVATRSEIKAMAKKGRISVDGSVIKDTSLKVDPDVNSVFVDGRQISYINYEYIMLNKPAGYISATQDGRQKTVLELVSDNIRNDLFPAGRLDIDTEGLLLLTNDGALSHRLLSPKHHVDKTYYVEVDADLPGDAASRIADGIYCDEELTALPGKLEIIDNRRCYLTIHEGKFHQVKRMMKALGAEVTYLKRLSMGPLALDEGLKCGEYRRLNEEELKLLKEL